MADPSRKVPENVAGLFYVDRDCDDCSLCVDIADENFRRSEDGWSYVARQPESEAEKQLCIEAMESCPSECIGDDG